MTYRYRIAEIDIPRAAYAATEKEWRELPEGETIVHVFGASLTTQQPSYDSTRLMVVIEQEI